MIWGGGALRQRICVEFFFPGQPAGEFFFPANQLMTFFSGQPADELNFFFLDGEGGDFFPDRGSQQLLLLIPDRSGVN